jgi:hypothetical protein
MLEKTKKIISFVALSGFLAIPQAVFAQGAASQSLVPSQLDAINNPITVIRGIIRFILLIAFIIAFIMLLVGGIRWIMAGGDEKSVEKARNTITAALIGLVVILVAYALIRIVELFFNVNVITGTQAIPKFNE